jgi:hypothetical protein
MYFSQVGTHNDNANLVMTTALQCTYNFLKTLAGFKPRIFCSVGGRDDEMPRPQGYIDEFLPELPDGIFSNQKSQIG